MGMKLDFLPEWKDVSLRVFEIKVVRRKVGLEREEVTGQ
jgi:hypothetical protein